MALIETEAIVLRTYRLGESDKIVSMLTRQMGRIRAVAKGAVSRRGRYGAALEPLSYIRVWIYYRENRDLQGVGSAEIIESFFEMQKDYRIQVAGQFLAEVCERFLPDREVNERMFRLMLAVLRAIKRSGEVNRPLLFFDYWLLRLGGFLPNLAACTGCQRPLSSGEKAFYGAGSEGLVCADCRAGGASEEILPKVLALGAGLGAVRLEPWIESEKSPPGTREMRRFFEQVIESHLEKRLVTRALLVQEV